MVLTPENSFRRRERRSSSVSSVSLGRCLESLGALFGEERLRWLLSGLRPEDFSRVVMRRRVALLRHIFLGERYEGYGRNLWTSGSGLQDGFR